MNRYVKLSDLSSKQRQMLGDVIDTKSVSVQDVLKTVWHDAKSDPPTEDGEYLTKKLIAGQVGDKEYSKWLYQQLHYTTDYGWNTYRFDEPDDKDQKQYALTVDYWTSELI